MTGTGLGDFQAQGQNIGFVDTLAGRLRYTKRGAGAETILLIHGFGGDLDGWFFNIDALAEHATVYAMDLPGHGQSTKHIATPSLQFLADTVADLMERLGVPPANVVGHSMGGAIAMTLAAARPDKVKSLTLLCSASLGPEISGYVDAFTDAMDRPSIDGVLRQLFYNKSMVTPEIVDIVLGYKQQDGVRDALRSLGRALYAGPRQHDVLVPRLAGHLPRTLVIWGRQDEVIPCAHAAHLPGAEVHVLEQAGHVVYMERPEDVNRLIAAHIA